VPRPLAFSPLDEPTLAEVTRRFNQTHDADTRLRFQMVLLAHQGLTPSQIAPLVLRSHDTVTRVLNRFLTGGGDAVPRRKAPGPSRQVTPAWEAELLRVIDLDPHDVGVPTPNWSTRLLADYLAKTTGVHVGLETVRTYLHAHDYVCKRPTWTLQRKAEEQPGYRGNA
jgi:transposase